MTQSENNNKTPLSIRVTPANRTGLQTLADKENRKISPLINQAIEEFLARRLGTEVSSNGPLSMDSADIERIAPVVKAIGAPISLQVFTDIIQAQRTASQA